MTTAALSPLRKQGGVSKDPTAPTVVLPRGSSAPPTATTSHEQGAKTSPTATTALSYEKVGRAGERADAQGSLSLSPTRTLVTPYCKRIRPGRTTTRRPRFPLTVSPPFMFRLAPTHLGWDTQRQFTRRSRDPPGSKHRQLARQVGACCVLTNSFPSSSRWVVSSNHSNPGRCSVLGVFSSCPSTVATT
jgi:hypothetical protein